MTDQMTQINSRLDRLEASTPTRTLDAPIELESEPELDTPINPRRLSQDPFPEFNPRRPNPDPVHEPHPRRPNSEPFHEPNPRRPNQDPFYEPNPRRPNFG